jgi:large subunit ribosomal protein L43
MVAALEACCTAHYPPETQHTNQLTAKNRTFLKEQLPDFARANPQIEFRVAPRPNQHPVIKGHYVNGGIKAVCVRNFEPKDIMDKVEYFKQSSGEKLKKQRKPVTSVNESVRGIWSPYHGDLKMV